MASNSNTKKTNRLSRIFGDGRNSNSPAEGSSSHPSRSFDDSTYASSENDRSSASNVTSVENKGQFDGVNRDRNLAVNNTTGDVFDEDTGDVVSTVTTVRTQCMSAMTRCADRTLLDHNHNYDDDDQGRWEERAEGRGAVQRSQPAADYQFCTPAPRVHCLRTTHGCSTPPPTTKHRDASTSWSRPLFSSRTDPQPAPQVTRVPRSCQPAARGLSSAFRIEWAIIRQT